MQRLFLACIFSLSLAYGIFWGLEQNQTLSYFHHPLSPQELSLSRSLLVLALQGDDDAIEQCIFKLDSLLNRSNALPLLAPPVRAHQKNQKAKNMTQVIAQSHAIATIALAISEDHQLLAIPSALRMQHLTHDVNKIDQVLFDCDQCDIEQLQKAKPSLCLASSFSNPFLLDKIKKTGCPAFVLPPSESIEEVWKSLQMVGRYMNQEHKANRLQWLCKLCEKWFSQEIKSLKLLQAKVAVLEVYRHLSLPSRRQIFMDWLVANASFESLNPSIHAWAQSVYYENMHKLKPDFMILLCDQPYSNALEKDKQWQYLLNRTQSYFCFLPTYCLHSPSQLLVLGLYDLVAALKSFEKVYHEN